VVFPHQLFENLPTQVNQLALVEEELFFTQFHFHKQKLVFHRASMRAYQAKLQDKQINVLYEASEGKAIAIADLIVAWKKSGYDQLGFYEPDDDWLKQRICKAAAENQITLVWFENPQFILSSAQVAAYFQNKKSYLQANFYSTQRKHFQVLMDGNQPLGGKWSFDEDNRKRFPAKQAIPAIPNCLSQTDTQFIAEAMAYVSANFPKAQGQLQGAIHYPITHEGAKNWLADFIDNRFELFGTYEDAMVAKAPLLHHSLLSVFLNAGLLLPQEVMQAVLDAAHAKNIPLNQTEGFVRQLLGWREFIRGIYWSKGKQQRTTNYWQFKRKIPLSFYTGETGIVPFDMVVKKLLSNAYCHHIERLMVLSNFMLLCEIEPDGVYQWFMELFVDAYDWVMVPNVYGMGQFADAGVMSTKPYISGSNYLLKMSDFEKGDWTQIWDALYWRFIHVHRNFFLSNPRMGLMVNSFDKMLPEKQALLLNTAEEFLAKLDQATCKPI